MINIDQVTEIMIEAAQVEIMPRFRKLDSSEIRTKANDHDFVTDADLGAERLLTQRLLDVLPGSTVVGEEGVYADRSMLDRLSEDAPVWVIDPLDGTGNFTRGVECFGVIVALVKKGMTVAGWLHDPIGKRTAVAEQGSGAQMEGKSLSVTRGMRAVAGPSLPKDVISLLDGIERPKCAAHMYLSLVDGRADVAIFRRLQPWDHAAGVLIHREAGGVSAQILDGQAYRPAMSEQGLLLAPDMDTLQTLSKPLKADFEKRLCGQEPG